jgi:predicted phage-related endonuclease
MKLQVVDIDKETSYQDWLNYRQNGIGASEVGTILGLNPWKCAAELYYQKIGAMSMGQDEKVAMLMGNELEPLVRSIYSYWNHEIVDQKEAHLQALIERKSGMNPRHYVYEATGFVLNPEFPHLFFSPDGLVLKDNKYKTSVLRSGFINTDHIDHVIEVKTISGWAAKQWDGGVPPSYYAQITTYLLGMGLPYSYLVSMEDGRNISCLRLDFDQEFADQIVQMTSEFWQRVEAGREAIENGEDYEEYCPPPDGTQAYENFLKKKYANPEDTTIFNPDPVVVEMARRHIEAQKEIKKLGEVELELKNKLRDYMGNQSTIDLGPNGKITWRQDSRGTRIFRNGYKG